MKRISARIGCVSSIGTNGHDNQTGQYQESTADKVGFPISAFPCIFRPVRHEIKYCHAGELICDIFDRGHFNTRFKRIN